MRLLLLLIFYFIFSSLFAQSIRVGIGVQSSAHYLKDKSSVSISDDISYKTINSKPINANNFSKNQADPNLFLYISYNKKIGALSSIDFNGIYFKKRMTFHLSQREINFTQSITKVATTASSTFYFPINFSFSPFKFLTFSIGSGPAIYFHRAPLAIDFRDTPDLTVPFQRLQEIHKKVSMNYQYSIRLKNRRGIAITYLVIGSFGKITTDLESSNQTFNTPTKWNSIGLFLSYEIKLSDLFKIRRE